MQLLLSVEVQRWVNKLNLRANRMVKANNDYEVNVLVELLATIQLKLKVCVVEALLQLGQKLIATACDQSRRKNIEVVVATRVVNVFPLRFVEHLFEKSGSLLHFIICYMKQTSKSFCITCSKRFK